MDNTELDYTEKEALEAVMQYKSEELLKLLDEAIALKRADQKNQLELNLE